MPRANVCSRIDHVGTNTQQVVSAGPAVAADVAAILDVQDLARLFDEPLYSKEADTITAVTSSGSLVT